MKVSCPNCHLKGLLDAESLATETRVFCVQCGSAYDVVLFDGQIETFLLPNTPTSSLNQFIPQTEEPPMNIDAKIIPSGVDPDNILSIPSPSQLSYEASGQAPILEDVFVNYPSDSASSLFEKPIAGQVADAQVSHLALKGRSEHARSKEAFEVATVSTQPAASQTKSPEIVRPKENLSSRQDNYSLGVQLMRISPAWLLIGGLVFISFIVLCNWLIKPSTEASDAQALHAASSQPTSKKNVPSKTALTLNAPGSKAVNQSGDQAAAIALTDATTVPSESKENPKAVAASAAPGAETKTAPAPAAAAAPNASSEATTSQKGGGLTLQVGSYSDIGQADARVASLKASGFEGRVVSVEIPKRGTWYRVQVGRFADKAEAVRFGEQMRGKGAAESVIVTEAQK